jgi:hypothetical protein
MLPLLLTPTLEAAEHLVGQVQAGTGAAPNHQVGTVEEVMVAEVAEIEVAGLLSALLDCLVVLQCERSCRG